ncbi:STM3941 family protein [Chryseobacterium kwangjuense]|uniref:STM3941 family protein n=1 Tax=Chryseobacterium kwangjuense TaxID=267125 RepID=A0ABW9K5E3_9FLAO
MKEHHFYSSKMTSFILLVVSAVFVYLYFSIDQDRSSVFMVVIYNLGFVLFSLGLIYSIVLLFRRKPLLTITDHQIIIYHMFAKPVSVGFGDIVSFYVSDTRHRGIKTAEHIFIVLKSADQKRKGGKSSPFNQQSIQVDILNVKTKVLLDLLQTKLRDFNQQNEAVSGKID